MDSVEGPLRLPAVVAASAASAVEGFADFYTLEWTPLVRLATGLIASTERAAEIAQDAFEKTLLRWGQLDRPGAYARTVVVNRCRSELRRRSVAGRFVWPAPPVVFSDEPDGELAAALAGLSPQRRIAVVLRFWADLPEADIAVLMGVRPGTVRSLLSRAMADLRKVVER